MPRSRSSGYKPKSSYKPYTTYPSAKKKAPPPPAKTTEVDTTPSPALGVLGGMMQGFGWGAGMEVGRRASDAVMGPKNVENRDVVPQKYCIDLKKALDKCEFEGRTYCEEYRELLLKANCT